MASYIVTKSRVSQYPKPIVLEKGDRVTVGKEDDSNPAWKGWIWCISTGSTSLTTGPLSTGALASLGTIAREGWVPKQYITLTGENEGIALEDYDATEMNVEMGDIILAEKEVNGWAWGKNERTGQKGWVPLENLCERTAAMWKLPGSIVRSPLRQGLATVGLALLAMAANRLFGRAGFEWVIGALALLAYEVANPILSAWARSWWRYVLLSLAVCAGLLLLLPLCAMIVSARSYQEIGETAMVYLVVMYYPFTIGLAGSVRLIFLRKKYSR